MLDNTLVTAQTGPEGRKVQTLYVTEGCDIAHEYYLAIVLDRETAQSVIIASTEGGMDIEAVAEKPLLRRLTPRRSFAPRWDCATTSAVKSPSHLASKAIKSSNSDESSAGIYKMFWEKNADDGGDQPTGHRQGRQPQRTRRQSLLRWQRAVPAP